VDPQLIRLFKSFLLAAIVGIIPYIVIVRSTLINRRAIALLVSIFLTAFLSSLAILYNDDYRFAAEYSSTYIYTIMFLISIFLSVSTNNIRLFRTPLIVTLSIYPLISLLIALSSIGLVPDFRVPREFFIYRAVIDTRDTNLFFSGNGFGGSRTGWGPATAVSTLLLIASVGMGGTRKKIFAVAVSLLTVFALYQIGARGAFLIFSTIFLIAYYRENRFSWGGVIAIAMLLPTFYSMYKSQSYDSRFRFNTEGLSFEQTMSLLTSNRYDTWVIGFESFMRSPVWGVGWQRSLLYNEIEPHNAWLNIAAKSGLIGLIPALFVLSILLGLVNHKFKDIRTFSYFGLPVLAGVLTAMIEPGFLFGSFFNATTFWLAVGLQAPATIGMLRTPMHGSSRPVPHST
jgi:hypothetical protein